MVEEEEDVWGCWRVGKCAWRLAGRGEQKNDGASIASTQRSFWVTDAAYVRVVLKWLVGGGKFGDG